jgi:3-phenylpropionate/trans-cinnamate dioxygenase ferredoxin reductase component
MSPIVVVGASLAGFAAVEALRSSGWDDPVVVVDPSTDLPSDRPPLSKQVLAGTWEPAQAHQPAAARLSDLAVDLRLGVAATGLELEHDAPVVSCSDGSELTAAGVVVACGASARSLPGVPPAGTAGGIGDVHVLRDLGDSLALRGDLDAGARRVVVVGAGFIGAEVTATCRARGLEVTMVETAPVPLGRVLPAGIGTYVTDLHRAHGVDVRVGVGVEGVETGDDGRVRAVRLGDGTVLPADVVVVGIGVAVNTGWLAGSGLSLDDGVRCDETCLAAPGVVAAGDVASWPNPVYGGDVMRVEHWEHAIEQGEHAGRRLLAGLREGWDAPADAFGSVPFFWSDQYDRKLQMVGRPAATDEMVVVDGSPTEGAAAERRFVVAFRRRTADGSDQCSAVLGVNRPRLVVQSRMRMSESLDWDPIQELFA